MRIVPMHQWKVPLKYRAMLLFPSGPLGLGGAADTMVWGGGPTKWREQKSTSTHILKLRRNSTGLPFYVTDSSSRHHCHCRCRCSPLAITTTMVAPVGTLKDGYVRNVPLPRVPQIQSASPTTSHELIAPKTGSPIPGYLHVPSWIRPRYPN